MSVEDNKAASKRVIEEGFNHGNLAVADELIDPRCVDHDPSLPERMRGRRGPEMFKEIVSMYRAAFPDLRLTVEDIFAEGEQVCLRWRSEGTHLGEMEGLAPTYTHAVVSGMSIDRYDDGKIVETWSEWDNLGLARQLGAAPPEGSMGERIGRGMQHLMARRLRSKHPVAA